MAISFLTGLETGHAGVFDLSTASVIVTDTLRGSWSSYAMRSGTGSRAASLASAQSEFYAGLGFYTGDNATVTLYGFMDSANVQNVTWWYDGAVNKLRFSRNGTGGTLLATDDLALAAARWYYLECHITISDTTGVIELRVDGASRTLTFVTGSSGNQDTRQGEATCARIGNVLNAGVNNYRGDDLYVTDTTGSQNTGYLGDIRVSAYIPNAAGDNTGLTRGGTDSGTNYGQVDERPPNDITDYVYGTGTTEYDLYALPNTSGVSSVKAVVLWTRSRKDDAGAGSIAHMLKSGGTENQGSDVALSTSWAYYQSLYNVDPTDSAAWTTSKLDALQVGVKSR